MLMNTRIFLVVMLAVMLGACSSTGGSKKTTAAAGEGSGSGSNNEVSTFGAGEGRGAGMSELDDPNSPLSTRIIYFEYDSSEIQERYREVVAAHADYLVKNPNVVVSLEGHADERGSREYNLALGERRALAVKRQMTLLGAQASQVRTMSYGEERPIESGHDDNSWSQNRRVELVY